MFRETHLRGLCLVVAGGGVRVEGNDFSRIMFVVFLFKEFFAALSLGACAARAGRVSSLTVCHTAWRSLTTYVFFVTAVLPEAGV